MGCRAEIRTRACLTVQEGLGLKWKGREKRKEGESKRGRDRGRMRRLRRREQVTEEVSDSGIDEGWMLKGKV